VQKFALVAEPLRQPTSYDREKAIDANLIGSGITRNARFTVLTTLGMLIRILPGYT